MGKKLLNYFPERQHLVPDISSGKTKHVLVQLSATPGEVTTIDIPSWTKYIKIFSLAGYIFYAVDEDPVNGSAVTSSDINSSDLSTGDFGVQNSIEARLPGGGVSVLHMSGTIASGQVYVSFSAGDLTVR